MYRRDRWTVPALAGHMVEALGRADRPVPAWLELLAAETAAHASGVETAIFGMA